MIVNPQHRPPLVSVIIPCYNAERWVGEAIESALAQSHPSIEVIVVNDGSTDGSQRVVASFGDRVTLINTGNKGGNHARNLGFSRSMGDYIQFLDADDVIAPNKVEKQLIALREGDADVAYGNWQHLFHDGDQTRVGDLISPVIGQDKPASLITDFWCPTFGYLFTRDIVTRSGGWDVSAKAIQDVRFMIDVALAGARFTKVDIATGYYRRYGNVTVSTRSSYNFNEGCYLNALKLEQHWRSIDELSGSRREALTLVYGQVARYFYKHDRPRFEEVYRRLRELNKRYIPREPRHLRLVAAILGYRNAEQVAKWYRAGKQVLTGTRSA